MLKAQWVAESSEIYRAERNRFLDEPRWGVINAQVWEEAESSHAAMWPRCLMARGESMRPPQSGLVQVLECDATDHVEQAERYYLILALYQRLTHSIACQRCT